MSWNLDTANTFHRADLSGAPPTFCTRSTLFYFPLEILFPTICSAVDVVSGAPGAILWTSAGELGCGSWGAESKVRRNLAPAEITEPLKWL